MKSVGLCGMLLLAIASSASVSVVAEEAELPVPKNQNELQAQLQQLSEKHHAPAVSYAVFDAEGVRFTGVVGVKQAEKHDVADENTRFQIGSVTKMVTAIAIMQLIEQGHFALTTPVKTLLPTAPIDNPFDADTPVTVGHLLSHTAGFDDMHFKAFLSPSEQRGNHLALSVAQSEPYHVRWRPGRYHSYSNPSYILLGAILEAHYQQPWDTIVERQVLKPLAMHEVLALTSVATKGNHAAAHSGDPMTPVGIKYHQAQADGALWSSARQLAELGRFMMTDGRSHPGVLRTDTVQRMKQPYAGAANDARLPWGYGLGVYHRDVDGRTVLGHTGGVIGAMASLAWLADGSVGYVVLTNTDNVLRGLEKPIARFLQPELPQPAQAALTVTSPQLEGWYRAVNSRNEIFRLPEFLFNVAELSIVNDAIAMKAVLPGTGEATLLPRSEGLLADAESPTVSNAALVRDAQGQVIGLLLGDSYMERVSALSAIAPVASVIVALLFFVTAPFGRRRALHNRWLRRLPTLALGLLIIGVVAALNFSIEAVMGINCQTLTVWIVTASLPFVALAGVALSLRFWHEEKATLAKWRCLLGSAGALTLSLWFAAFHWFALAIWAW